MQAAQPAPGLDPNRFSILKKPAAERPDPYAALRRPLTPQSPR
jgi:hypothetical protein